MTTPTPQDGEGLVSEEMVERFREARRHHVLACGGKLGREADHVALAAVTPDIAAEVRRQCAEELREALRASLHGPYHAAHGPSYEVIGRWSGKEGE